MERVLALVERVGFECGESEVGEELLLRVDDHGVGRARGQRSNP